LIGGEAEVAFVRGGDLAEGELEGVFHAAAHDEEREVRVAVFAGDPAVAVAGGRELKARGSAEG
jgi:hypothetical protein